MAVDDVILVCAKEAQVCGCCIVKSAHLWF
jgi:hypothetical protein